MASLAMRSGSFVVSTHTFPDDVVAEVAGNAPREIKEVPLKWLALFRARKVSFANPIAHRIKVVEVSVVQNPEDEKRIEGRVVCEIDGFFSTPVLSVAFTEMASIFF
ncbi:hypothetical protein DXG01_001655 [Tephrocybe rancida]|nr:hypothetical protein DXG01_001655 [Tephrocybe rancida]